MAHENEFFALRGIISAPTVVSEHTPLRGGAMSADAHGAGKKDEHAGEEKPKKSKKKLIIIVLGALSLVGGAGVPMLLMGGGEKLAEEAVEEEHHEEPKHIETADLGQFVVNLSESTSFLKVHIMMEYDAGIIDRQTAPKEGEAGGEGGKAHGGGASGGAKAEGAGGVHPHLAKKENQLRDVVIQILSSKQSSELLTSDGKNRTKQELVDGLNEAIGLEEPPVVGILFTEFIIQ
jgi:flagellar basal body-associated protein FliL